MFAGYRMIIFGGLVALLLILRPRGLLDETVVHYVQHACRRFGRARDGCPRRVPPRSNRPKPPQAGETDTDIDPKPGLIAAQRSHHVQSARRLDTRQSDRGLLQQNRPEGDIKFRSEGVGRLCPSRCDLSRCGGSSACKARAARARAQTGMIATSRQMQVIKVDWF